ncbi:SDR family oxidoreductase [Nonlabens spongiae]|uniref:SDR family oxidoreductase n=1 Tax=Nonlabens spongiae TaxID=331648 RepID=UPI0021D374D9|nr:SDR family oxidoreductase [Nonlabens spongiae]
MGPAYIDTPLLQSKEMLETIKKKHPMKRLGKTDEVAQLVLILSSSQSSFITGGYYLIDGGCPAV